MNVCIYRTVDNQCRLFSCPTRNTLAWCVGDNPCDERIPSNADRIRSMSDEELAEFLYGTKKNYCDGHCSNVWDVDCPACALKWLKKGADHEQVEVKHAQWIDKGFCSDEGVPHHVAECSICGYGHGNRYWKFCPNCGARMVADD